MTGLRTNRLAAPARHVSPPRRGRDGAPPVWPGADPAQGPALFLDQLAFWDVVGDPRLRDGGRPDGPYFEAAGAEVRRIPPAGSVELIGRFLSEHHYTAGAGMRGLAFGLYRGSAVLGIAVFSRVCRPRWAAENFALLALDSGRSPLLRRHLTVTEAEYAVLSRLALAPIDSDGRPLGKGAASWFLSRCLAGLEARNRALWTAHQRVQLGLPLDPTHRRLLRESAGADHGRGRGFIKGVATWADPYENMLGRIYQILAFHYAGRTNGGAWTRERVGLRSGRRLSARTLAKALAPSGGGHAAAALRLAWEGGEVAIEITDGLRVSLHDAGWVRGVVADHASEHEIASALRDCWSEWQSAHVPAAATVRLLYSRGSGVAQQHFPPKHAYFTGLGAPWYRRQTEIRYRRLTHRLLAEESRCRAGRRRVDRRRDYYPSVIPSFELRPALRALLLEPEETG